MSSDSKKKQPKNNQPTNVWSVLASKRWDEKFWDWFKHFVMPGEEERKDSFFCDSSPKIFVPPLSLTLPLSGVWKCFFLFLFLMVKWEKFYPSCQLCVLLWRSIIFMYSVDHLGKVAVREKVAAVSCNLTALCCWNLILCRAAQVMLALEGNT